MLHYTCVTVPPKRITKVQFGLLSPEEIDRVAVCSITDTTIYHRGLPNPNGINDNRMGARGGRTQRMCASGYDAMVCHTWQARWIVDSCAARAHRTCDFVKVTWV